MMKAQKIKNKTASNSQSSKPFFGNKGEGTFFSRTQVSDEPFYKRATIQPKLTIGQPNDKYEKEADSMADQFINSTETNTRSNPYRSSLNSTNHPLMQRLSANKSPSIDDGMIVAEEETSAVQRLRQSNVQSNEPLVSKKELDSEKDSGRKLDDTTRLSMETHFGKDFSNVRIHNNAKSEALTSSVNARAFAYGNNIYFNRGEYRPETREGKRTIAHELTHVVQQGGTSQPRSVAPKIQRLAGLGAVVQNGVAPWSTPHPVGTMYEVSTDAGTIVHAWVAYSPYKNSLRYWCHGHSLGTYNNSVYGYSVYSGSSLAAVIKDEWRIVPPSQTKPGDIAVWTAGYDHSAKFVNPVIRNGQLDPAASTLSTKNGQNALTTMSLNQIAGIYGSAGIAVYRHV